VNLLKSPFRRTTAVLAGAFIGLAGAVAIAAPASAHHPEVSPESSCINADGSWTVKWTITNSEDDLEGTITSVRMLPRKSTITGIEEGDTLPKSVDGALHAVQTVEADAKLDRAFLAITAHWVRDDKPIDGFNTGTAPKPTEECGPETPPTTPPTTPPSTPPSTPPTTTPTTPPSSPPASDEPTPILDMDCTTMTIGLANPATGEDITLHFKTSKGEERTDVIKPGESKTEKFSATTGFTVTLTADGIEGSLTVPYEQPDNCDNSGGGGGLPVTGAAAGSIAGGAAVLLIAGGVLFFLARRRKVKFTA
jgi:LPXTG-motif cell wall-anchored protein